MPPSSIPKPKINVHSFPRPPLLERTPRHLRITTKPSKDAGQGEGVVVADTDQGYWVLETTHAPTYYLPRNSVRLPLRTSTSASGSFCEWKGRATYYDIDLPSTPSSSNSSSSPVTTVKGKIWSYLEPTTRFTPIAGYLAFYAQDAPWDCFVDGEKVQPQEGSFYGGWVTGELEGRIKGGPGTWGW